MSDYFLNLSKVDLQYYISFGYIAEFLQIMLH